MTGAAHLQRISPPLTEEEKAAIDRWLSVNKPVEIDAGASSYDPLRTRTPKEIRAEQSRIAMRQLAFRRVAERRAAEEAAKRPAARRTARQRAASVAAAQAATAARVERQAAERQIRVTRYRKMGETMTLAEIAAAEGLTRNTVARFCRENGVSACAPAPATRARSAVAARRRALVLKLASEGVPAAEIARRVGCDHTRVHQILKAAGVSEERAQQRLAEREARIARFRKMGETMTLAEIAAAEDQTKNAVAKFCRNNGITVCAPAPTARMVEAERRRALILELAAEGVPAADVAQRAGCDLSRVYKILKVAGVGEAVARCAAEVAP